MVESRMGQPLVTSAPPAGAIIVGTSVINPYTGAYEPSTYSGPRTIVAGPESMERSSELLALNIAQAQQRRVATKAYEEAKAEIQALQKEADVRRGEIKHMAEYRPLRESEYSPILQAELQTQRELYKMILPEYKGADETAIASLKKLSDIATGKGIVKQLEVKLPGQFFERVSASEKPITQSRVELLKQKAYEQAVTKAAQEEMQRLRKEYFAPAYEAEGKAQREAAKQDLAEREVLRDTATMWLHQGAITQEQFLAYDKENYQRAPTNASEAAAAAKAEIAMWMAGGGPQTMGGDAATNIANKKQEIESKYNLVAKIAIDKLSPEDVKNNLPEGIPRTDEGLKWFYANASTPTVTSVQQQPSPNPLSKNLGATTNCSWGRFTY